MTKYKLSIVIPCFNEEKRLPIFFPSAYDFFVKNFKDFEIILVDDGSFDKTKQVLNNLKKEYSYLKILSHNQSHQGKGHAIKLGVDEATGEIIGFMDADFAISLTEIKPFIQEIKKGADIVIANRNAQKSHLSGQVKPHRLILGKILAIINNRVLQLGGITDTQCGFKFFKGKVAHELFSHLQTKRWLFDLEILVMAKNRKYKIVSKPVSWSQIGDSKVNIAKDLLPVLNDLIRIYFKAIFNT